MPLFTPLQIPKLVELARKGRIAPVYLMIGAEEELLREKDREIYSVIQETGALIETYDLKAQEKENLFSELQGFQESLFGMRKVFVILSAEGLGEERSKRLLPIFDKKELFTWFLLAKDFSEKHPVYRYALEKGVVIPFAVKRKEDFLQTELIKSLKAQGKSMEKAAAELFLSLTAGDYHHFKNELEKLLLYTEGQNTITQQEVWEVVIPLEKGALYLLGDALFQGAEKAYQLVLKLIDSKIDPHQILGYLYKYFKRMALLSEVLERHPELRKERSYNLFLKLWQEVKDNPVEEIPRLLLETHPYPLFNMKRNLEKVKDFSTVFSLLYEADLALKKEFQKPEKAFFTLFFKLEEAFRGSQKAS